MTGDQVKLREEHDNAHEETLKVLHETDQALLAAETAISKAREKLKIATEKYEERLYGPEVPRPN